MRSASAIRRQIRLLEKAVRLREVFTQTEHKKLYGACIALQWAMGRKGVDPPVSEALRGRVGIPLERARGLDPSASRRRSAELSALFKWSDSGPRSKDRPEGKGDRC